MIYIKVVANEQALAAASTFLGVNIMKVKQCMKITETRIHLTDAESNLVAECPEKYAKDVEDAINNYDKLKASNEKLVKLLKVAACPNCDGSGAIPHQVSSKQFVTRDMAIDAGDPNLEGSLYSDDEWEAEQCQWCYEKDVLLSEAGE